MNTTIYNQLLTDTQEYIKLQYQLLQVKSIEQASRLIGVILTILVTTVIVVIGLIFLAIALAAWLEQWLPMWASYLVIAGAMMLIAFIIYWARGLCFVRPIEKYLGRLLIDDTTSLKKQKQYAENQVAMQRELLQRDMTAIRQEWTQIQRFLLLIKDFIP
jgi:hypothetical protein